MKRLAIGVVVGFLIAAGLTYARPEWLSSLTGGKETLANRPKDNALCLVCHENLRDEDITKKHLEHDTLCVDCHGPCKQHMEDEMLMTRPDVLFGRTEVGPFCDKCHDPAKHSDKTAFLEKWRGRDRPNGRVITDASICTDCHGTHNIVKERSTTKPAEAEAVWTPLFNGTDLSGWEPIGNAKWSVQNGNLVGEQGPKNAPGDLLTQASYRDFLLTCTYRVEWPANTGVWFRYQTAKKAYQADILEWPNPIAFSGTLYCPGKMFLAINSEPKLEDREGWNTLSIRAEGDHLQIWLNGHQTADVHDAGSDNGKIGFQVHPGAQFATMRVIVREINIQELKK